MQTNDGKNGTLIKQTTLVNIVKIEDPAVCKSADGGAESVITTIVEVSPRHHPAANRRHAKACDAGKANNQLS